MDHIIFYNRNYTYIMNVGYSVLDIRTLLVRNVITCLRTIQSFGKHITKSFEIVRLKKKNFLRVLILMLMSFVL